MRFVILGEEKCARSRNFEVIDVSTSMRYENFIHLRVHMRLIQVSRDQVCNYSKHGAVTSEWLKRKFSRSQNVYISSLNNNLSDTLSRIFASMTIELDLLKVFEVEC